MSTQNPVSKKSAASREHRKAVLETQRRAARRRVVRNRLLLAGSAVVIVAIIAFVIASIAQSATTASRGTQGTSPSSAAQILPAPVSGATTTQSAPHTVADTSGIPGVLAWDTQGWPGDGAAHAGALEHSHVTGPVNYAILPPVGGPHSGIWMNAGVYTKPVVTERAIHDLEHGAVWITYNPNLPAAQVAQLTAFVTRQSLIPENASAVKIANDSNRYIDLSPWASNTLPSPIVVSSWGHQLRLTSPTDSRLQQFIDTFRYSKTYSPEYGEPVDGIPVLTGGRAALDGGTQPNPPGTAN